MTTPNETLRRVWRVFAAMRLADPASGVFLGCVACTEDRLTAGYQEGYGGLCATCIEPSNPKHVLYPWAGDVAWLEGHGWVAFPSPYDDAVPTYGALDTLLMAANVKPRRGARRATRKMRSVFASSAHDASSDETTTPEDDDGA